MFRSPDRARQNLAAVDSCLAPENRGPLDSLLKQSADPDAALDHLARFLAAGAAADSLSGLRLRGLLDIFAHSHFLAETLVRHPELEDWVFSGTDLDRVLRVEELRAGLGRLPSAQDRQALALALARFKRRHLLRIILRDVERRATLSEVTLELSNLADTMLEAALGQAHAHLASVHGPPRLAGGAGDCEFAILALGKLGGQELNYSSDIDLMFLFTGGGETEGPRRITNKEFAIKLANEITAVLSTGTADGFCYRVDLRLRPEGRLGEVAVPLSGAQDYYERRARDWELQMLIKARVAAGSRALGRRFQRLITPLIYKTTTDFSALESVSETRQRIHERLRRPRRISAGLNIKLSRGGIRDIEFLVQCLQRLYGGRNAWVRHGGTVFALHRLRDKGFLSDDDYALLSDAYQFLRVLEHRLQMEDDRQVHTLPRREEAMEILARKMGAWSGAESMTAEELRQETGRRLEQVGEIYERLIRGHRQEAPQEEPAPLFELAEETARQRAEGNERAQWQRLEERSPALAEQMAKAAGQRGRAAFERFLANAAARPDVAAALEQKPELVELTADLFEHAPVIGDWLIRNPPEIEELLEVAPFAPEHQGNLFPASAEQAARESLELGHMIRASAPVSEKSAWLRRFYRRHMLRILTESICRRQPIFATLEQTTQLADWVVHAAYEIATGDARQAGPQAATSGGAVMHVIALGRLGMREFDFGSDADLVFVLPDEAQAQMLFWTRVAERMIDILSSYTGEGVIFSVDSRLRPLGAEGELVQTEGYYKKYCAGQAQAWEAITYMKSRCLAGDLERGTAFLNELQTVDWRRFGQSGELGALLTEMRRKLEEEQGETQPLKAGRGGYYDIDFALMYLRLKGAGIFYRSLNTPERIDVIERMGLLDRPDADFLRQAAVFYRSLDHALRVAMGRSEGALPPAAGAQAEIVSELVRRWAAPPLGSRPLADVLSGMRRKTRAMFDRIFGQAS